VAQQLSRVRRGYPLRWSSNKHTDHAWQVRPLNTTIRQQLTFSQKSSSPLTAPQPPPFPRLTSAGWSRPRLKYLALSLRFFADVAFPSNIPLRSSRAKTRLRSVSLCIGRRWGLQRECRSWELGELCSVKMAEWPIRSCWGWGEKESWGCPRQHKLYWWKCWDGHWYLTSFQYLSSPDWLPP
jgi:hypothetical protein